MRCPSCKNKVLQKSGDTTRLRTHGPLVFTENGTCKTKCYWCKAELDLPVQIQEGVDVPEERFLLTE